MKKRIITVIVLLGLHLLNAFCGPLENKLEQILYNQQIIDLKGWNPQFTEEKIKELAVLKVDTVKKINLSSYDNEFYYICWHSMSNPDVSGAYVYELVDNKLQKNNSIFIWKLKTDETQTEYILDELDHYYKHFLHKPNFFSDYRNSHFYSQCEQNRISNTLSYVKDIDNDGNDEIFSFHGFYASNMFTSFVIYKYLNQEWKTVFEEPFYSWEDFFYNKWYKYEEWYFPKKFPYDFVEYKGKKGLRIVTNDYPLETPSIYHAWFWSYDENTQNYELLEEISDDSELEEN